MGQPAILIESQYLPPVQYFVALSQAGTVYLEAHEHYQKRSYRNRAHLAGPNGPILLSVPLLKGKNEQLPVTSAAIAYRKPWFGEHWHSIRTAYGKSPFFDFYAPEVEAILRAKHPLLYLLNLELLRFALRALQLGAQIRETDAFGLASEPAHNLHGHIHPIQPKWAFNPVPYPQVFEDRHGFLPNLSILDLIFCTGPEAPVYLQRMAAQNPLPA
ncbi:WbqC family protein [Phaeodactylibacter luteus]|uniref:WbqC family protein n=1 Tax=Phaeodactylibacter luteus TaxID=1564516 RepID=A0A5C6RIG4_9BACT|nr:WbqC family protein [Phaeodactylibacter luteus]TXB61987.1 WbqC family protein [Phaeodactylibacter luteus]